MVSLDDLVAFQVGDDEASGLFIEKLCQLHDWTPSFAHGAFIEYKRFIYLAVSSSQSILPSMIVDQVWQLHLTFTRSYWVDLCETLLQRPLHYYPSLRKNSCQDRLVYQDTAQRYLYVFNHLPPEEFWPPLVCTQSSLMRMAPLLAVAMLLTACSGISSDEVIYGFKWVLGLYVIYRVFSWLNSGGGGGGGGGGGFGGGSSGGGCSSGGSSCGSGCGGGGS